MRVHTLIWMDETVPNEGVWFDVCVKSTGSIILRFEEGVDIGDIVIFPFSGIRLKIKRTATEMEKLQLQKALIENKWRKDTWQIGPQTFYVCEPNVSEPAAATEVAEPTQDDLDWLKATLDSVPLELPVAA
jgi:hypothetical protein